VAHINRVGAEKYSRKNTPVDIDTSYSYPNAIICQMGYIILSSQKGKGLSLSLLRIYKNSGCFLEQGSEKALKHQYFPAIPRMVVAFVVVIGRFDSFAWMISDTPPP